VTARALMSALGTAALSPLTLAGAEPQVAGDPWAIGYAVQVARDCPGWQVERQQVLAQRGILPRADTGSDLLAMNGPFQRFYYEGQGAAEADRRRVAAFCDRVPAAAGRRWTRLARVLRRARS